jgi:hypothetical protein
MGVWSPLNRGEDDDERSGRDADDANPDLPVCG